VGNLGVSRIHWSEVKAVLLVETHCAVVPRHQQMLLAIDIEIYRNPYYCLRKFMRDFES
jgi:hypothetical protein